MRGTERKQTAVAGAKEAVGLVEKALGSEAAGPLEAGVSSWGLGKRRWSSN